MMVRSFWVGVLALGLSTAGCSGGNAGSGLGDGGGGLDGAVDSGQGADGGITTDGGGLDGCVPLTCDDQGIECGRADDGCGHPLLCGICTTAGDVSGGGGVPGKCDPCVPDGNSCAALGYACGIAVDSCGNLHNCADEGLTCGPFEVCSGTPTTCQNLFQPGQCDLCPAVPDCSGQPQLTQITGRVVTPGRNNSDTANQIGVPNAFVYILRNDNVNDLPAIDTGIPSGGTSCDRCDSQQLGPVLTGAVTDATGQFTLEGNIPVGTQFLLVVKAGKFRRAVEMTIPANQACQTTSLPTAVANNPARLPRTMSDGLAVNIPHIAVTTGEIDAMECVFYKMGIATSEFGNPGTNGTNSARIHLYRGGTSSNNQSGARIDGNTPYDSALYGSLSRILGYDMVVADCEGPAWDSSFSQQSANGAKVREFVNRGGRMFASHLSFSWLDGNGTTPYSASNPVATGLDPSATWQDSAVTSPNNGAGRVSFGRTNASPRIQNFADWMVNEGVIATTTGSFNIVEPRSQASAVGSSSEEFVYCPNGCNHQPQQFSFNTPYGAPAAASCGRVAYSGFHVSAGGSTTAYANAVFPNHCEGTNANNGVLTDQEKVLLYMLFDLGTCVGQTPTPPACVPLTCAADYPNAECGYEPDGCGGVLDCGSCPSGQTCGGSGVPNQCSQACTPVQCQDVGAACGSIADGCGQTIDCGTCPTGYTCLPGHTCVQLG